MASGFALLRCDASVCNSDSTSLPKINLFVTKALQPLSADSKLLDGYMTDCELRLRLTAPLTPSQTATQNVGATALQCPATSLRGSLAQYNCLPAVCSTSLLHKVGAIVGEAC